MWLFWAMQGLGQILWSHLLCTRCAPVIDVAWYLLGPRLFHARTALGSGCGLVSLGDRFTWIFENCHLGAGD